MPSPEVTYLYDLRGLQKEARFANANADRVESRWDGFGRQLSSETVMDGVGRKLTYAWDREGNRTSVTHPDNAVFTYSYDGLGRMTRVLEGPSYTHNDQLVTRYYYNAAGLRLSAVRGAGSEGFTTSHYYDGAGRLESMHHTVPDDKDLSLGFAYTPSSQIAQATRSNDVFSWTDHYNVTRGYAANGLNQYASAGPAAFEYDGRGNLTKSTTAGVASTFHYDAENRLVGAGGNRSVNFRYDPLGRLHEVKGSGVTTTRFLYDGEALVAEYGSTGTLLRRYVHGPGVDEPVALYEGAAVAIANRAYFQPDERGSIIALVNADGTNRTIKTYDEYGIPAGAADGPVAQGRFAYTGQAWLPEIGMYYYKARIYSPTLGRFLQVDPIGYEDQFNLYAYVRSDPINFSDPTGEQTVTDCAGVTADCNVTAATGKTFTGPDALEQANLAVAPHNAALTAATGHEWYSAFEQNSDESVTPSVSVSDKSPTSVTVGGQEILSKTANPIGDQHVHPTPAPGSSYGGVTLSVGDVDSADAHATQYGSFNRTIIDGPSGRIVSFDGRPGSMQKDAQGRWQRLPGSPASGKARVIGTLPPIPYKVP